MLQLTGKTAIITGASSGIGAAIARHLASEGANVVLAARRKEKLDAIAKEINSNENGQALAIATNVATQSEVEAMVQQATETFGPIAIYVNNAGLMLDAKVRNGKVDAWDQMVDVNIKGALYGINAIIPSMVERAAGHIINISSVSGHEVTKVSSVYSATKFAIRALSMGMEKELAHTGVRVTNISPGMVDTELASNHSGSRKPLDTNDIARAIVYAVTQPDYVNVNEITVRPV